MNSGICSILLSCFKINVQDDVFYFVYCCYFDLLDNLCFELRI